MSDTEQNLKQEQEEQEQNRPSYTPASFEKRAAAWMGVAYAVFFLFVVTFAIFTGGKGLPGTFPLLLVPVSVEVTAVTLHRQKTGTNRRSNLAAALIVAVCAVATGLGLALGVPALIDAVQNAY